MAANSRFAMAVHAVTALAHQEEEWMSSDAIAWSANTNPVVVRRILGALRRARLVRSQPGKAGGTQLARPADQITLLDVYRAVKGQWAFAFPRKPGHPHCPGGGNMRRLLTPVFADGQRALERTLSQTTIADLLADLPR